ncbi:winged helix-turn-helix domain-containing protein [Deinococcus aestuarii]|uniref:winged helix-turn-helix domain-containing protein n=1 Tax=Deinococcus aestuarii TaxID=2774531 RepID=UPI001C0E4B55|nr:winged helix-turn-helix domain-containing protein [Deinococcus aestuarii]
MTGESVRVANGVQAALLLDVGLRPLLDLLIRSPRSVGEVASELRLKVQRAHYLVGKLERAGVAEVVEVCPRTGRPVKRYAVPPRWFIPYEATGAETLEAFLDGQILPRVERFTHLGVGLLRELDDCWGFWLEQGEEGSNLSMGTPTRKGYELFGGDEPFLLNIGGLRLTREQAGEFKRRLLAVMEEFQTQDDPDAPTHTVALMLVRGDVG